MFKPKLTADSGPYKGLTVPLSVKVHAGDDDAINKTPFPLVEMEFFKADSDGVKHNLNILGDTTEFKIEKGDFDWWFSK